MNFANLGGNLGGIDLGALGIPGANTSFTGLGLPDNLMASLTNGGEPPKQDLGNLFAGQDLNQLLAGLGPQVPNLSIPGLDLMPPGLNFPQNSNFLGNLGGFPQ